MGSADTVERLRLGGVDYLWQDGLLQDAQGRDVPLRAKSLKLFSVLLADRGQSAEQGAAIGTRLVRQSRHRRKYRAVCV